MTPARVGNARNDRREDATGVSEGRRGFLPTRQRGVFLGRAQRAPGRRDSRERQDLAGAREHGFEEDRRRAGEAEHLRVGAS